MSHKTFLCKVRNCQFCQTGLALLNIANTDSSTKLIVPQAVVNLRRYYQRIDSYILRFFYTEISTTFFFLKGCNFHLGHRLTVHRRRVCRQWYSCILLGLIIFIKKTKYRWITKKTIVVNLMTRGLIHMHVSGNSLTLTGSYTDRGIICLEPLHTRPTFPIAISHRLIIRPCVVQSIQCTKYFISSNIIKCKQQQNNI